MNANRRWIKTLVFLVASLAVALMGIEHVAAESPRYTLTIFVDDTSLPNGHVFLGLSDGRRAVYRGFYSAQKSPKALLSLAGGMIKDDTHATVDEWTVKKTYPISKAGYAKAFSVMEDWDKEGRPWGIFHHCGDFVNTTAKAAGINLNLPVNLKGYDRPGRFGQYLREQGCVKRSELATLKVLLKSVDAGAGDAAQVMVTAEDQTAVSIPGQLPQVKTVPRLDATVLFPNLPSFIRVLVTVAAEGRKPVTRAVRLEDGMNVVTIDLDNALVPGGGHIIASARLQPLTNKVGGASVLTLSYSLDKFDPRLPVKATTDVWITGPMTMEFGPRAYQVPNDGKMQLVFMETFPFAGDQTWHYAISAPGYQSAVGTISCKVVKTDKPSPQYGNVRIVSATVTPKQGGPGEVFTLDVVYKVDGATANLPADVLYKATAVGPDGTSLAVPLKRTTVTNNLNQSVRFTGRFGKQGKYTWYYRIASPGRTPGEGSATCAVVSNSSGTGLAWKLIEKQLPTLTSNEKWTQKISETSYHYESHQKRYYRHSVDLAWNKPPAMLYPGQTISFTTTGSSRELETKDRWAIGCGRECDWFAGVAYKKNPTGWITRDDALYSAKDEAYKNDHGAGYGFAAPGDGYKQFARPGIRHFQIPRIPDHSSNKQQYCFLRLVIWNAGQITWIYQLVIADNVPALVMRGGGSADVSDIPATPAPGDSGGAGGTPAAGGEEKNLLVHGDFEAGFSRPWGTGLYSENRPMWWNAGNCKSSVSADGTVKYNGRMSLHVVNPTARQPNCYGTTAQRIAIQKNRKYRITLWARAYEVASNGAISIIVDSKWSIRPIVLPAGTYGWREFQGTFSLPADYVDLRILTEDKCNAWIDGIRLEPVP
ncbi:MAG: carbohydrate binding domain-containing protein [Armatimonadota bacterium]